MFSYSIADRAQEKSALMPLSWRSFLTGPTMSFRGAIQEAGMDQPFSGVRSAWSRSVQAETWSGTAAPSPAGVSFSSGPKERSGSSGRKRTTTKATAAMAAPATKVAAMAWR